MGMSAAPDRRWAFFFDHDGRVTPAEDRRTIEGGGELLDRRNHLGLVLGKVAVNSGRRSTSFEQWMSVQGWHSIKELES